jgi:hypothetical protein
LLRVARATRAEIAAGGWCQAVLVTVAGGGWCQAVLAAVAGVAGAARFWLRRRGLPRV